MPHLIWIFQMHKQMQKTRLVLCLWYWHSWVVIGCKMFVIGFFLVHIYFFQLQSKEHSTVIYNFRFPIWFQVRCFKYLLTQELSYWLFWYTYVSTYYFFCFYNHKWLHLCCPLWIFLFFTCNWPSPSRGIPCNIAFSHW